ncbi:MAG: site-specific integrase [Alphaproteobacteria bacterium]|nr:site-specific integrase [Alphaproteobacteria bacterium]
MCLLLWESLDSYFLQAALAGERLWLPDSKTGEKAIFLPAAAVELLSSLPRVEGNPHVIVGQKAGGHLIGLRKIWMRVRRRAELNDVRIHDLRHSFASAAIAGGMSLPLVGKLLGHKPVQTTARYAHLADDPLRIAAKQVGGSIEAAMKGGGSPPKGAKELMPYKPTGRPLGRPKKVYWANPARTKPNLTKNQWAALHYEYRHFRVSALHAPEPIHEMKPFPSRRSAAVIARHAKVSRQAVRRWRESEPYCRGLIYLFAEKIVRKLDTARGPTEINSPSIRRNAEAEENYRFAELCRKVKRDWPQGGLRIPRLDGRLINPLNPNDFIHHNDDIEYAQYLRDNGSSLIERLPWERKNGG